MNKKIVKLVLLSNLLTLGVMASQFNGQQNFSNQQNILAQKNLQNEKALKLSHLYGITERDSKVIIDYRNIKDDIISAVKYYDCANLQQIIKEMYVAGLRNKDFIELELRNFGIKQTAQNLQVAENIEQIDQNMQVAENLVQEIIRELNPINKVTIRSKVDLTTPAIKEKLQKIITFAKPTTVEFEANTIDEITSSKIIDPEKFPNHKEINQLNCNGLNNYTVLPAEFEEIESIKEAILLQTEQKVKNTESDVQTMHTILSEIAYLSALIEKENKKETPKIFFQTSIDTLTKLEKQKEEMIAKNRQIMELTTKEGMDNFYKNTYEQMEKTIKEQSEDIYIQYFKNKISEIPQTINVIKINPQVSYADERECEAIAISQKMNDNENHDRIKKQGHLEIIERK